MSAAEVWLRIPDKQGWWFVATPTEDEMIVSVEELEPGVLCAWLPMERVVSDEILEPGAQIIVYFTDGRCPTLLKDWRWKEIEIPDFCPEFDVEED